MQAFHIPESRCSPENTVSAGTYPWNCPLRYRPSHCPPFPQCHMIRHTVLGGPIEENEHSGHRFGGAVQPEATLLEPLYSEDAAGEFAVGAAVQVAALVGTPADKTGAPLHMVGKSVPAPIGFAVYVAHLGQGYIHNGIPVLRGVEHLADWVVPQHMGDIQLTVSVPT